MSSLSREQQQPIDDFIRCGFMEIGQAMHETVVGVNSLVEELEARHDAE